MNILLRTHFIVPIFDSELWIVVAHDAKKALNRMAARFKEKSSDDDFAAMCVDDESNVVGLFFNEAELTEAILSHEISHAVDSILRHIGHKCQFCDEPRAYLNGYLTKRIHAIFRRHKIKILRSP